MKRNLSLVLVSAFIIISILHLLVYASLQQVYRQAANDGPRLLAGLLSAHAAEGRSYDTLDANTRSVVAAQGVFYVVAGGDGSIRATNLPGYGAPVARMPKGVVDAARKRGVNVLTWAPQGVRYALVLQRVGNTETYVGGCKPLLYTESNMMKLWQMVLLSWLGCSLSLAFAGAVLFRRFDAVPARHIIHAAESVPRLMTANSSYEI
jgi:hypothetical protein